jgi:hypothetical protein
MKFYRYKLETIDDGVEHETGFVVGHSYSDAVKRLEEITTTPSGKNNLVGIELYEVDAYSIGAISDTMITETFDYEKDQKGGN